MSSSVTECEFECEDTTELVRIDDLLIKDEQMVIMETTHDSLHWELFETLVKPISCSKKSKVIPLPPL